MKKTHQWMLFFLFLFLCLKSLACTKKEEKLVFYQTTQIQKMDDSKEDTQFFQEEAQTSQVSESSLHETTQAAVETIAVYLCGEVCKPGVYVLQAGSRLYQAVEEAGGLTANAQAEAVNLAGFLQIRNRFIFQIFQNQSTRLKTRHKMSYHLQQQFPLHHRMAYLI